MTCLVHRKPTRSEVRLDENRIIKSQTNHLVEGLYSVRHVLLTSALFLVEKIMDISCTKSGALL